MGADNRSPVGVDSGYAWVAALACFFINFLLVGISRSVGVLYMALVDTFGVSRQAATFPFSVRPSLRNLSGPLIGLLGMRYGIRAVTMTGGFVAALGSILCYFAPNIVYITVFWGVIHGIGFGLSTVIHMMIINQYFDKYKASALGLGYSGDCFGTFAFPVIIEYLLANYTVRETFLILGGVLLNILPMAMLLRKPPWLRSKKKRCLPKNVPPLNGTFDDKGKALEGYKNDAFYSFDTDSPTSNDAVVEKSSRKVEEDLPAYKDVVSRSRLGSLKDESANSSFRSHRKASELSEFMRDNMERHGSLPPVFEKDTTGHTGGVEIVLEDVSSNENKSDGQQVQYSSSMKKRTSSFVGQMAADIVHRMRSASFASQVAQDGFITTIHQEEKDPDQDNDRRKLSLDENGCCKSCGQEVDLSATDLKDRAPSHASFLAQEPKQTVLQTFIRTNTKPIFVLISTSMAVYAFLFVGVLTIIIDYAVDLGVSNDQGKFLIIGFSVTDLVGRLSFGQIIDRNLVKMKNYSGVTMLLMGTLVFAIPFNTSFNYMMVCMCMYGLVQGGTAIMFPILVSYYMDKNEESVAMGCLNFYGGLLMLCLAPMIGYFRDNTGSYTMVFHILGGMVALIGLIWQLEPIIIKFQRKQQLKREARIAVSKL